ncbi:hypothetical protein J7E90_16985 [Streptomyces sp. ISL-111]|uniref:hypothetical protein n=1 Tax=Streptomyces sp. ISL-111 TaxID=2819175 RepID=UPI001BEA7AAE|nr:hypothetical protein [Streptomyces sp. ISL-111]MBT2378997.1 hypothetical protein [Streptomyces sp. ISL-111]
MSASTDPLRVVTSDGAVWVRAAVTRAGLGLYCPEGVTACPRFVMATLVELAEHGVKVAPPVTDLPSAVALMGALPMPVGTAAELEAATYVAPSPSCTRCYGADALRFVAKGGATEPCRACAPSELDRLRARVAELEAAQSDPVIVSRFDTAIEPTPEEEEQVLIVGAVADNGRPVALLLDMESRSKVARWLAPQLEEAL